jgi:hypothetical protein
MATYSRTFAHIGRAKRRTYTLRRQGEKTMQEQAPQMTTTGFIAIRRDTSDGHEWMDTQTFQLTLDGVHARLEAVAYHIPCWDAANPVQRIVPCTLMA